MTHPAERYLANGYLGVRGMSSLFAARIIVGLLRKQSASGIKGHLAEIGVFEGRLLIALAHCLAEGERVLAVDHFAWPDAGIRGRFDASCAAYDVPIMQLVVLEGDSRQMTASQLTTALGGSARFFHIDGEHTAEHLHNDLRLATAVTAEEGVVALDDMLHPGYPTLALTVHAFLDQHPAWRVLAIIDREDIVGAAKYLLCREALVERYTAWLRAMFAGHLWPLMADFRTYTALVLTPEPKLAAIG